MDTDPRPEIRELLSRYDQVHDRLVQARAEGSEDEVNRLAREDHEAFRAYRERFQELLGDIGRPKTMRRD